MEPFWLIKDQRGRIYMIKHTVGKVLIRWSGANPMSISKSFKNHSKHHLPLSCRCGGKPWARLLPFVFFNLTLFHTGHISRCSQTSLCTIMPCPHKLEASLSTQEHYRMQSRWRCAMPCLDLLTSAPRRINESRELTLKGRRQRGKDEPPCYPESPMWSELKDTTCPGVV